VEWPGAQTFVTKASLPTAADNGSQSYRDCIALKEADPTPECWLETGSDSRGANQSSQHDELSSPDYASDARTWQTSSRQQRQAVFVDAESMKEKIRSSLCKPPYNVADFYHNRGLCQAMARSQRFEQFGLAVIAVNAIWIAVDTDYNTEDMRSRPLYIVFPVMNHIFCTFFTAEWLIRFAAFRHKRNCLKDVWFVIDSTLLVLTVAETWVMTAFEMLSGTDGQQSNESSMLRLLRLLRLSRMARMARLLRVVPELMILIRGMAAAVRSVFFTLCLLVVVIYGFAIAITQLAAGSAVGTNYFATVPDTMYVLLMRGTLLDNVEELMTELKREHLFVALLFLLFILIAALTVMNMLIGVLCEVVGAVAAVEKEEMAIGFVKERLRGIVWGMDNDADRHISRVEMMGLLENREAVKALHDVGVDATGLVDCVDIIFESDTGESYEKMSFSKFLEVILEWRGSCSATVKDIVNLRKYVRNVTMKVLEGVEQSGMKLATIEEQLHQLIGGSLAHKQSRSSTSKPVLLSDALLSGDHCDASRDLICMKRGLSNEFSKQRSAEQASAQTRANRLAADCPDELRTAAASLERELAVKFEALRSCLNELALPLQWPSSEATRGIVNVASEAETTSSDCQVSIFDSGRLALSKPKARGRSADVDSVSFLPVQPHASLGPTPHAAQRGSKATSVACEELAWAPRVARPDGPRRHSDGFLEKSRAWIDEDLD